MPAHRAPEPRFDITRCPAGLAAGPTATAGHTVRVDPARLADRRQPGARVARRVARALWLLCCAGCSYVVGVTALMAVCGTGAAWLALGATALLGTVLMLPELAGRVGGRAIRARLAQDGSWLYVDIARDDRHLEVRLLRAAAGPGPDVTCTVVSAHRFGPGEELAAQDVVAAWSELCAVRAAQVADAHRAEHSLHRLAAALRR